MGIKTIRSLMLVWLAAFVLAGCETTQQEDETMTEDPATTQPTTPDMDTPDMEPETVAPPKPRVNQNRNLVVPLGDEGATEELAGLFYFDFDQAIVKRAGHVELNKHANALTEDRSLRVRLEGHCDERGTREYNLALGERRANAVKAYLQAQGVLASQMETISYGEEKPAAEGHNEQAWAQNRRVEIVYR